MASSIFDRKFITVLCLCQMHNSIEFFLLISQEQTCGCFTKVVLAPGCCKPLVKNNDPRKTVQNMRHSTGEALVRRGRNTMEMPLVSIPCFLANVSSGFSAFEAFPNGSQFHT